MYVADQLLGSKHFRVNSLRNCYVMFDIYTLSKSIDHHIKQLVIVFPDSLNKHFLKYCD